MLRTSLALLLLSVAATHSPALAEKPPAPTWPPETVDGKFDWVQTTSGEWLKGEIIAMYDEELEFDSEEFETLVLDWSDVAVVRSAQVTNVGFLDDRSATGHLVIEGSKVRVTGTDGTVQEFERDDLLTITVGEPKEINYWSMKVFAGLVLRSGNSSMRETNVQANVKRRTIRDRITIDVIANENTTDGAKIADNQRAAAGWDKFISDRFFLQPVFGEYYRDPFLNLDSRVTVGVGAGYQLMDSAKIDWSVSGGPAYQETQFSDVLAGDPESETTPALVASTDASWDISKWLEFDGQYRAQVVREESGSYNHHLVASFETEITTLIDFDVSWIWDRVQDPQQREDATVPAQDDFRTTVGLTFEF